MHGAATNTIPRHFARCAAPIACGGALVAAAAFLATHDPASPGARFPGCPFHQATGLWCPGCGLTRGTYQLLHGDLAAALGYNVFTPLALIAIAVVWIAWLRRSWGAPPLRLPEHAGRLLGSALPMLIIAYGVLRNLPLEPLSALAP